MGGTTLTPSSPTATATTSTVVNLNTASSGYPAASVKLAYNAVSGPSTYDLFTVTGAAAQYNVPSFEMGTVGVVPSVDTVDITFPVPTTVYFPILDVDTSESVSVQGFNGSTAVSGANKVRTPSSNMTVTTTGTTTTFAAGPTQFNDNDGEGMVEVNYPSPVTRIRLTDTLPFGSNEIGNIYSCQALDVVKSATTPTLTSNTSSSATYHTTMKFSVGNTEPAGSLRVYAPNVVDVLASTLSGTPNYSSVSVSSISATGPPIACAVNTAYNGITNTSMLRGAGFLEPGESCAISVELDVVYPITTSSFTKLNSATTQANGTNPTLSESSTNGSSLPTQPKGDTASPTPLVFPAAPRITLTKALATQREASSDQFTVAIRTGGSAGSVVSDSSNATTTGTGSTVTAGSGTTGAFVAVLGTAYTLTEAAAGTTSLSNYDAIVTCVDLNGVQTGLPSGVPYNQTSAPTITPVAGANITCTITNTGRPIVSYAKKANVASGALVNPGDQITYTLSIRNSGATPTSTIAPFDDLTGVVAQATISPASISASSGNAVYDPASKRLTWTGVVPAFSEVTVTYQVTVSVTGYGTLSNAFMGNVVANPISASLVWRKVDAAAPSKLLSGSAWSLTPINGSGQPTGSAIAIVDCTSLPCSGSDSDSVGGQFRVPGLMPGSYALSETKAPAGYVLDSTPITLTVSAMSAVTTLPDVTNKQVAAVKLPLTGGTGTDVIFFWAFAVFTIAGTLLVIQLARRARKTR